MESAKCKESSSGIENVGDLSSTSTHLGFEQKLLIKFDHQSVNTVNGNHKQHSPENLNDKTMKTRKSSSECGSDVKSSEVSTSLDTTNNELSEREEKCSIKIKTEVLEEETLQSAEIFSEEKIKIKQEESDSEELQKPLLIPNGNDEICIYCSEIKREGGKKNTLDFLSHHKVTSLKRNRSSQDIPADIGLDGDKKVCIYCSKSKFTSRSMRRPASPSNNDDVGRPRSESSVSESDMSPRSGRNMRKKHKGEEVETDPVILARRQKQINYGKNTTGYKRYQEQIPKDRRSRQDPVTPPKHVKYSRRGWDGLIKAWRRRLHNWDPPRSEISNEDDGSFLSESPAPTVSDDSEILMDVQTDTDNKEFSWVEDVEAEESLKDE